MPKATISFNLPEEQAEYRTHQRAGDMASILYEFSNLIREKAKYAEKQPESWDEVKSMWWEVLNDYKVDPYED